MRLRGLIRQLRDYFLATLIIKNSWRSWKAISSANVPCTFILRNGLSVHGPDGTAILRMTWNIFNKKEYTPKGYNLGGNDIVVDIGANIGIFTLYAATMTSNTILAYEPFPENVSFLQHNIDKNGLTNAHVSGCAVSGSPGTEELMVAETSWGHKVVGDNASEKWKRRIEVPSISLKQIMDDNFLSKIDFLKMDCEGAEGAILTSLPKDHLQRIEKIALEFHDNVSCKSHTEIACLLESVGFNTVVKWNGYSNFGYLYARRRNRTVSQPQ